VSRYFTRDYSESATLRDGSTVVLRMLTPEDKELLRRGFESWSHESRYARFLSPKERLTEDELDYLCEINQETHFALGAVRDGVGLGIARFIRLAPVDGEPVTAEAAIAIADNQQGKGLGKLLFLRLCAAAAERGVERFRCEVLASNHSIQGLIESIAPEHTTHVSAGVVTIDFTLPGVAPTAPVAEPLHSAMYRFFRAAAEGAIEWTAAVRRMWRRD
jgi:acetyltransferase